MKIIKLSILMLMLVFVISIAWAGGFYITAYNSTDKVAYIKVKEDSISREYKVKPRSSKNIPILPGKYSVCLSFERDFSDEKCYDKEITERMYYDDDGNKLYWEISD